jgi:translation initiation factor 5A
MDVPNVNRNEYQLLGVDDGFLNLMNTDGGTKDDVKLPDGKLGEDILAGFEVAETVMVTVTAAMGEEQVTSFKVTN